MELVIIFRASCFFLVVVEYLGLCLNSRWPVSSSSIYTYLFILFFAAYFFFSRNLLLFFNFRAKIDYFKFDSINIYVFVKTV